MSVYATGIARIPANLRGIARNWESRVLRMPGMFSNNLRMFVVTVLPLDVSLGVCAARRLIDFTTQSLVEQILEDVAFN